MRHQIGDDLILDQEYIRHRSVQSVGPEDLTAAGIAELHPDTQLIVCSSHAAGDEVAHTQGPADITYATLPDTKTQSRSSGDHKQFVQARQRLYDVFNHAICEIALIVLSAVGERKDRNRRIVRQRQGTFGCCEPQPRIRGRPAKAAQVFDQAGRRGFGCDVQLGSKQSLELIEQLQGVGPPSGLRQRPDGHTVSVLAKLVDYQPALRDLKCPGRSAGSELRCRQRDGRVDGQ